MVEGKKETVILTFGAQDSLAKSGPMVQWTGEVTERLLGGNDIRLVRDSIGI